MNEICRTERLSVNKLVYSVLSIETYANNRCTCTYTWLLPPLIWFPRMSTRERIVAGSGGFKKVQCATSAYTTLNSGSVMTSIVNRKLTRHTCILLISRALFTRHLRVY